MKLLILAMFALVSCGQNASENNGTDQNLSANSAASKNDVSPSTAMLVGSLKNMPECSTDMEGQLIYVKDDKQFYFCDNAKWQLIDLQGKDGKDGVSGTNGINGKDGKDGTNGINGKDGRDGLAGVNGNNGINGTNGTNGAAAPVLDDHSWIHPITGKKWFIGKTISSIYYSGNEPNLLSDGYLCPQGSTPSTEEEYLDAFAAGIWYKFSAFAPILVQIGDPGYTTTYQYGANNTVGTEIFYKFRIGSNSGVSESYIGSGVVYGKALCIVND